MNIRAEAARTLAPILKRERSLQSEFDARISSVPEKDRGLFHEMIYGSLRHFETLDALAQQLLSKKLKNKDSDVYALILLGLYQLKFLRIPDHAAISETVNAAAKLKKVWAKKLINALLRGYQREEDKFIQSPAVIAAKASNCPVWLLDQLKQDWPDHWQNIVDAQAQRAPLTVRINVNKKSLADAQQSLSQQNVDSEACRFSRFGLTLTNASDIASLTGFSEGWLSVQDEAAQCAADLLELAPNLRVLDACAAPGGKTCHILETEPKLSKVLAVEFDDIRAKRIEENFTRLGLNAEVVVADAANTSSWFDGQMFDRILLDAPCSATGVIRRHPDIKLLRRADDLIELTSIQYDILCALWQTLQPGGTLLYATCSILKQENEAQIERFLNDHLDAEHSDIDLNIGLKRKYGRQLFPTVNGHDGFYYARLKKQIINK